MRARLCRPRRVMSRFYMWSQRNAAVHGGGAIYPADSPLLQKDAVAAYDVSHARPWGWQVPAYSWTKSIGSGVLAVPAIAMLLGRLSGRSGARHRARNRRVAVHRADNACCWSGILITKSDSCEWCSRRRASRGWRAAHSF